MKNEPGFSELINFRWMKQVPPHANKDFFREIRANFLKRADFSEEELDLICRNLVVTKVKKKGHIQVAANIPQFVMYVQNGLLRMYRMEEDGMERTIDFCQEDTWMADLDALYERKSTTVSIEALEDSEIIKIHYDDIDMLHKEIPALWKFSRSHAEEKFNKAMKRLQTINYPGYSAQQRIDFFEADYPDLEKRVASHVIASFLGIAPETYSRLRQSKRNP